MPCSKEGVLMSFEDVLRGLQVDIPVYTQAQMEEDDRQLHVLISAAVLQREVAKNLQVHSWLVPASPECTALLLEGERAQTDGQRSHAARERAAEDLLALCELVVQGADAEEELLTFVEMPGESQGALVFACLLQLCGYVRNARFWWHFAAGAGSTTAAYCLFLDGLLLNRTEEAVHCYERLGGADFVRSCDDDLPHTGGVSAHFTEGLHEHIEQVTHEDFGIIALPGPGLPANVGRHQTSVM
ncbi:hypothetical protein OG840_61450 [Streptomyces sp. NBC_01764]|uniref:hypothetical protein n=1 Tax=Streptomyces sp. NBC_01764 TaxID=2975935 RepID=UPI00225309D6|nr:hypothetical protein [Streptomyces sp. NBC_01764]MCX4411559.1 hypothetical protein [Streptomyces sp. NBC_01764]